MIDITYWTIMAFYVIVIGICMMIGAYIARLVRTTMEFAGFIIGAAVGIFASYWLYVNYGRRMVLESTLSGLMR